MSLRYCEMCDKWFKSLRTVDCPDCGDATKKVATKKVKS